MHLKHLSLTNFRNYVRLELELPPQVIILQGGNAQGKTNFLEAIYYLATTRSPWAKTDREMVNWLAEKGEQPFARLVGDFVRQDGPQRIEIALVRTQTGYRKHIRLNGVQKRALDLLGQVNVVLFHPQDVELVSGSPALRRRYLDLTLCQIDGRYRSSYQSYARILLQRNHLLRALSERPQDADQLYFWDEKLAAEGAYLIARRGEVLATLEELAREVHLELTGGQERLRLRYVPGLPLSTGGGQLLLRFDVPPSFELKSLQEAFRTRLKEVRAQEIVQGVSLIGPHRDDLRFLVGDVEMNVYASRGQQRTIALSLKLAEMELIRRLKGESPLLLLDEVMAELDEGRRNYLLERISGMGQAILTATDPSDYRPAFLAQAVRFQVREGRITAPGSGQV